MSSEGGFTLVEMLVVLAITTLISMFTLPLLSKTVVKQEHQQFFHHFASDMFLVQNETLYRESGLYRLVTSRDRYRLYLPQAQEPRYYPKSLAYAAGTIDSYTFSRNGTLKNPTRFIYFYEDDIYTITYPFGKGRGYVARR